MIKHTLLKCKDLQLKPTILEQNKQFEYNKLCSGKLFTIFKYFIDQTNI